MNSKKNIISKIENFLNYIRGKRKGAEANDIEKEAMTDAFLCEALEGVDAIDADHYKIIDSLRAKIMQRSIQRRKRHRKIMLFGTAASINAIFTWSAAACASAVIAGGLIYFTTADSSKFGNQIAYSENASNEIYFRDDFSTKVQKSKKEFIEEEIISIKIAEPPMPSLPEIDNVETENLKIVAKDQTIAEVANFDADELFVKTSESVQAKVSVRKLEPEEYVDENIPFLVVEERPKFMGKDADFFKEWVQKNIEYPENNANVQGQVVLSFIIDTDGKVTDVNVIKKLSPELDAEAVRVVSSSPTWTPAKQMRSNVKFEYVFPVTFLQ